MLSSLSMLSQPLAAPSFAWWPRVISGKERQSVGNGRTIDLCMWRPHTIQSRVKFCIIWIYTPVTCHNVVSHYQLIGLMVGEGEIDTFILVSIAQADVPDHYPKASISALMVSQKAAFTIIANEKLKIGSRAQGRIKGEKERLVSTWHSWIRLKLRHKTDEWFISDIRTNTHIYVRVLRTKCTDIDFRGMAFQSRADGRKMQVPLVYSQNIGLKNIIDCIKINRKHIIIANFSGLA